MNQRQREDELNEYLLEQHLASLFNLSRVNLVLDVGANEGQYARRLRHAAYDGRIVSFEPIEQLHEVLLDVSRCDGNWAISRFALGSKDGEAQLNVTSNPLFSSFLRPNAACEEHFGEDCRVVGTESVSMRRLDSILDDLIESLPRPRIFLKMDTQGYDLEVFEGLGDYVERVVGLQSELSIVPLYEGIVRFNDAIRVYESHGFEITSFHPVQRSATFRLLEVDCIMARSGAELR